MLVHEYLCLANKGNLVETKKILYGVEYEIESVRAVSDALARCFFDICVDHSLRNHGKELITKPMAFDAHMHLFKLLHNKKDLVFYEEYPPFSHRTSIHIHVNCMNLEVKVVKNIIRGYILLEKLFMRFVGPERENSIFCVPLYNTHLMKIYNESLHAMLQNWHKYTAFNLCRMGDLGTIEFRHLYGTDSFSTFAHWFSIIEELFTFFITRPNLNFLEECSRNRIAFVRSCSPLLTGSYSDLMLDELTEDCYLDLLQGYL